MFTCRFEKKCFEAEEKARNKHFGQVTGGIKYWWKKITWIPWLRDDCNSHCWRYMQFERNSYKETLDSKVFNNFLKRTSKQNKKS